MATYKKPLLALAIASVLSMASASSVFALTIAGLGAKSDPILRTDALIHKTQGRGTRGGAPRVRRGGGGGPRVGGRRSGGTRQGNANRALGAAAAVGLGLGIVGALTGPSAAKQRRLEIIEEERRRQEYYDDRRPAYRERVVEERPVYRERRGGGVEYCIRTFRSYNPETGYYRDFSGNYIACP